MATRKIAGAKITAYFDMDIEGAKVQFTLEDFTSTADVLEVIGSLGGKLVTRPQIAAEPPLVPLEKIEQFAAFASDMAQAVAVDLPAHPFVREAVLTKETVTEAIITLAREKGYDEALKLIRMFVKADGSRADKAGDIAPFQYESVMATIAGLK